MVESFFGICKKILLVLDIKTLKKINFMVESFSLGICKKILLVLIDIFWKYNLGNV